MAVKIRLTRTGKRKQPSYRIVAADSRAPRDGRFLEILGHYNPRTDPSTIVVDNENARGHAPYPSRNAGICAVSGHCGRWGVNGV